MKKILKSCVFCLGGVKCFASFRIFLLDIFCVYAQSCWCCNILDFQGFKGILISFSCFFFQGINIKRTQIFCY